MTLQPTTLPCTTGFFSRYYNTFERITLVSLAILVFGLFVSTALCSLAFALLIPPCLFFSWKDLQSHKFKSIAMPSWFLVGLACAGILATSLNHADINGPFEAVFKTKYFVYGALAVAPLKALFNNWSDSRTRTMLLCLVVGLAISNTYGLLHLAFGLDPLGIHNVPAYGRNYGATDCMRHAHSCLYALVVLTGYYYIKSPISKSIKGLLIFAIILTIIGLISSGTRGATGAALISVPIMFWKHKHFFRTAFVGGILAVALIILCARTEMATGLFRSIGPERANIWMLAIKAIEEKPLLGHGVRQFEAQGKRLVATHGQWIETPSGKVVGLAHAHNIVLQFWADTGIIGLSIFIGWLWAMWRAARFNELFSALNLSFIFAFCSAGMFQYVFDTQGALCIMTVTAAFVAQAQLESNDKSDFAGAE
ncbi:MAG: hypothetical protein CMO78_00180 [Verrucomicrobiales bacterium]|nr:hypothetical protein [Verrucomicrobiales bacterium]